MNICGRCYVETTDDLFEANCFEKPEELVDVPIGMYHCPDCGCMLIAGLAHPKLCNLCLKREHILFD